MPVSTSAMITDVAPCVMAQAGSMSMLERTAMPFASERVGARRYHCPDTGPCGATLVDRPSGYSGSLTGDAWM